PIRDYSSKKERRASLSTTVGLVSTIVVDSHHAPSSPRAPGLVSDSQVPQTPAQFSSSPIYAALVKSCSMTVNAPTTDPTLPLAIAPAPLSPTTDASVDIPQTSLIELSQSMSSSPFNSTDVP